MGPKALHYQIRTIQRESKKALSGANLSGVILLEDLLEDRETGGLRRWRPARLKILSRPKAFLKTKAI